MFSTAPRIRIPVFCAICAARTATCCAAGCGVVTTSASARGQELPERHRDVAGPRRHVHEQRVELAPVDVREELLERLVEHRPAPHDRRVLLEEEADRHQLQVAANRRHDHLVDRDRLLVDAEHVRDRVAVDVAVEHADLLAERGQRVREVGGERRLPDPSLARRDRDRRASPAESEIVRSAACPPRSRVTSAVFSSGVMTSKPSRTRVTPATAPTCRETCSWNESRSGQPTTVSAIVTETEPSSSTRTSRTMSSSVTGRRSSGSMTFSSALRIASRSGLIAASVPAASSG